MQQARRKRCTCNVKKPKTAALIARVLSLAGKRWQQMNPGYIQEARRQCATPWSPAIMHAQQACTSCHQGSILGEPPKALFHWYMKRLPKSGVGLVQKYP